MFKYVLLEYVKSLLHKENKIRCNMCWWHGNEEDLIKGKDKEGNFDGCPKCMTDHYLMNLEKGEYRILRIIKRR